MPEREPIPIQLSYDDLKQEFKQMEGDEISPENFAKYLLWSLGRSGASQDSILKQVEKFNQEFPHTQLTRIDEPVSSNEGGINAGVDLFFKLDKASK